MNTSFFNSFENIDLDDADHEELVAGQAIQEENTGQSSASNEASSPPQVNQELDRILKKTYRDYKRFFHADCSEQV